MKKLEYLNEIGFKVTVTNNTISIIKNNRKSSIGLGIMFVSILTIILTLVYLTIYEKSYQPILFRIGIASGIFLFLVGAGIRSKKKSEDILFNLINRQLVFGDSKSWSDGVRYKYFFHEITQPKIILDKKKYLCTVNIKNQTSVILELKKKLIEKDKVEEIIQEIEEILMD